MNERKIYSAISIVFGVLFLYALYSYIFPLFKGYSFGFGLSYWINMIPLLIGITGLIIFIASGYKKSNLFRMYMCFIIFNFPFTSLYYIGLFTRNSDPFGFRPELSWPFYLSMFITLVYAVTSCWGLWLLTKRKVARVSYVSYGNEKVGQFEPASGGLRFANRLIDALLIVYILINSVIKNRFLTGKMDMDILDSPFAIAIIEIPVLLLYYILFEGIFNTTAGKCATNTTIVNEQGERPNFGQILGRTFCRLIPLEAFSFLGASARGWHDSIPNTYVVDAIDKDELALNEITLDAETENPVR